MTTASTTVWVLTPWASATSEIDWPPLTSWRSSLAGMPMVSAASLNSSRASSRRRGCPFTEVVPVSAIWATSAPWAPATAGSTAVPMPMAPRARVAPRAVVAMIEVRFMAVS